MCTFEEKSEATTTKNERKKMNKNGYVTNDNNKQGRTPMDFTMDFSF